MTGLLEPFKLRNFKVAHYPAFGQLAGCFVTGLQLHPQRAPVNHLLTGHGLVAQNRS